MAAKADHVLGVVQADDLLPAARNLPEITMLYVDPPAWGSGVASLLLRSGLEWIDQQGHREARLRVVEVHHRARRFYEREGLGRRPSPPACSERLLQPRLLLQDARWLRTVRSPARGGARTAPPLPIEGSGCSPHATERRRLGQLRRRAICSTPPQWRRSRPSSRSTRRVRISP